MDRDNVTSIEAHKLADLIMAEWISAYSDNGSIWAESVERLRRAKENEADDIIAEAQEIAHDRWRKMHKK